MANVIDLRPQVIEPSKRNMMIDAALGAFQTWSGMKKKKKQEEEMVKSLLAYLPNADPKERAEIMGQLTKLSPEVFAQVSSALPPPKLSEKDAIAQMALRESVGYRDAEQFDMSKHGLVGAAPPAAAGLGPLPEDPAARRVMMANRAAIAIDPKALDAPYMGALAASVLPSAQQPQAMAVETNIAPKADVVLREAGETARNTATTGATMFGHRTSMNIANLRAAVDREEHGVRREGHDVTREGHGITMARGELDSRRSEVRSMREQYDRNKATLNELNTQMQKTTDPDVLDSLRERSRQLIRDNEELFRSIQETQSAPMFPRTNTQKGDKPNRYSAEAEALIQSAMESAKVSREAAIAALKMDPRTADKFR